MWEQKVPDIESRERIDHGTRFPLVIDRVRPLAFDEQA
jgi:hypothetical protein